MALQRLKDAAEKAKCELSLTADAEINLPFIISTGRNEALHLQRTLSRSMLTDLTADLIERTIDICRDALFDAGMDVDDIDDVLLVGGMTRMPAIHEAVEQFFKRRPNQSVHPDEVVALGAAIQGASLLDSSASGGHTLLLDVTPHALGIMTAGSNFEEVIAQNTTVPTSSAKVFTTSRDNQTAVKILVMQGESRNAADNELLGEFILTGLRQAKRGEVEVEVTFQIDTDGIVSVSAKDLENGKAQSIQVTASSGLTREEIDGMITTAQDYLVERRTDEAFDRIQQQAETLWAELEQTIPEVERMLGSSEFGKDALAKARVAISGAKTAAAQGDPTALATHLAALERTQRMFKGVVTRR